MAGEESKSGSKRARLPILPPAASRRMGPRPRIVTPQSAKEESIYTLKGYKAWAARVKAAWDGES